MTTSDKILMRSRKGVIGGVCSGVAEYLDIDANLARCFTVVVTLLSGGLLLIAYLMLWMILPLEPEQPEPVNVAPDSCASEVYDRVVQEPFAAQPTSTTPPFAGGGHVPPPPPSTATNPTVPFGAASAVVDDAQPQAARSTQAYAYTSAAAPAGGNPAPTAASTAAGHAAPGSPVGAYTAAPNASGPVSASAAQTQNAPKESVARTGVLFGIVLVVFGVAALMSQLFDSFDYLQFWPLFFILPGIFRMVVPGKKGRVESFSAGLILAVFGVCALLTTVGFVNPHIEELCEKMWSLMLVAAGLFVLARVLDKKVLILLAAVVVSSFFVAGVTLYADMNPLFSLSGTLPWGQSFHIDSNSLGGLHVS